MVVSKHHIQVAGGRGWEGRPKRRWFMMSAGLRYPRVARKNSILRKIDLFLFFFLSGDEKEEVSI